MPKSLLTHVALGALTAALVAGGLATPTPASAATATMSTRYALSKLPGGGEHVSGYDRSKFSHWADADGDGCDARDEVLIKEAGQKAHVGSGCRLTGGTWWSPYDGAKTTNPSTFDVDHMIPLNEAWQSGAWNWSAAKRKAFANDLGYKHSLIAVSASSNRSKGDREPQDWMPTRAEFTCIYAKRWVAVKWRWKLRVNPVERAFLEAQLNVCGWPRVAKPGLPVIPASGGGTGGGGGDGGVGGGTDPRFDYCYNAIAAGYGPYYRGSDPEYDWYTDADGDGVVCE